MLCIPPAKLNSSGASFLGLAPPALEPTAPPPPTAAGEPPLLLPLARGGPKLGEDIPLMPAMQRCREASAEPASCGAALA